jgi:hypothetical protein
LKALQKCGVFLFATQKWMVIHHNFSTRGLLPPVQHSSFCFTSTFLACLPAKAGSLFDIPERDKNTSRNAFFPFPTLLRFLDCEKSRDDK